MRDALRPRHNAAGRENRRNPHGIWPISALPLSLLLGVHKAHLCRRSSAVRKLVHIAGGGIFEMGSSMPIRMYEPFPNYPNHLDSRLPSFAPHCGATEGRGAGMTDHSDDSDLRSGYSD